MYVRKGGMELKKMIVVSVLALFMNAIMGMQGFAAQSAEENALQISGGFFHAQDSDVGTATLSLSYGYFVTRPLEVGVSQSVNYNFVDDGDDTWTASTIPFVNYHFLGLSRDDVFQPFIGMFIGAVYNDDDSTGTIGPNIGFKAFIHEKTYLTMAYRYEWFFEEMELGDVSDTSSGNHVVTLGLGILW